MKSRQIKVVATVEGGLPEGHGYCRRCGSIKKAIEFYNAWDKELDKANGLMSVCKSCCNSMFDTLYESEHSIEKAVLRMCRSLNLKFDERSIQLTISHLEGLKEKGKAVPPFFGIYKFKLTSGLQMPMAERANVDLTYQEVTNITVSGQNTLENFNEEEIDKDVILFWGEGFSKEEYAWLERELDDWKSSHRSDTKSERTLLREIVFKQFEIEKARREGKSTDSLFKGLESALKTANLDPNKANAAGAGKSQDTFSSFISLIESGEPAEVFGDERDAFKDFQNIDYYFKKYVVRSIKNFVTGSKDFSLENNEDDILLDDADVVLDDDGISNPEITDDSVSVIEGG